MASKFTHLMMASWSDTVSDQQIATRRKKIRKDYLVCRKTNFDALLVRMLSDNWFGADDIKAQNKWIQIAI